METTPQTPTENGQPGSLCSGDLFGVYNAPAPESGTNCVEVTVRFPANWLPHIQSMGEEAFRGDLYWLKQLCAKITIAAMPRDSALIPAACSAGWHCSSCGIKTEHISPLGPPGVIICEECAATDSPFVSQFRTLPNTVGMRDARSAFLSGPWFSDGTKNTLT